MGSTIVNVLIAGGTFLVLDGLWFAVFMKRFAESRLYHLLRLRNGKLDAHIPSVMFAYSLMILGTLLFLVPRVSGDVGIYESSFYGGAFGLVTFGIFDGTNSSLFRGYPALFTIVDVVWGTFMCGCVGVLLSIYN